MLPATVNILGSSYTVRRVPFISRTSYRAGEINFETQEITILDSLKEETAVITFFHELLHGILNTLKYFDEGDDEKLIQAVAIGLYQALGSQIKEIK